MKSGIVKMDGAIGTYLKELRVEYKDILKLSTENEEIVKTMHKEYIRSGAKVINTNTFMALNLLYDGFEEDFIKSIKSSLKLINEAKNEMRTEKTYKYEDVLIALDFGPLKLKACDEDIKRVYKRAKEIIKENFLNQFYYVNFETQYRLNEAKTAAYEFSDIKKDILLSFTFDDDGKIYSGEDIETIVLKFKQNKHIVALGANCCDGLSSIQNIICEFKKYWDKDIIAKPNLGIPKEEDSKLIYTVTKDEFKDGIDKLIKNGATFVGGCCGTTPEYIEKI